MIGKETLAGGARMKALAALITAVAGLLGALAAAGIIGRGTAPSDPQEGDPSGHRWKVVGEVDPGDAFRKIDTVWVVRGDDIRKVTFASDGSFVSEELPPGGDYFVLLAGADGLAEGALFHGLVRLEKDAGRGRLHPIDIPLPVGTARFQIEEYATGPNSIE